MKRILILLSLIPFILNGQGTTGIDNNEPSITLEIEPSDANTPNPEDGIIIPRVSALNTTDPKEIGLLVFYESGNSDSGFYWWDGTTWQPFVSISQISADLTLTHAFCKNAFKEGNMTANTATNLRTLEFDGLETNDVTNYEINTDGELVVKKPGKFHVYGIVYPRNISSIVDATKRDGLEAKLLINNADASNGISNYNIEGANGFPTGNHTIAIFLSGVVQLNADDRLSLVVNRFYRDESQFININLDPNVISNLTLKYLGPL